MIEIDNTDYPIYSYRYFDINSTDSSIVFFITKEFGVINAINRAWDNKFIIIFSNKKYRRIVEELNHIIMKDTAYYWYDNILPPIP